MTETPLGGGPSRVLSASQRVIYLVSGSFWGVISLVVCALDWITGHMLDGLILDFIYVTAGIVAYLQLRAAWTGRTNADLSFRGEYRRVRAHFDTYSKWLFKKLRFIK